MNLLGGTLAIDASSVLHAFSIGPDGNAWAAQQTSADSSAWTAWSSCGQPAVPLIGPIAAATDGDNALQIFATGENGNVYNAVFGTNAWTAFGTPTGVELRGLGAVADTTGRLWLLGVGVDGNVYWNWETGGIGVWTGWANLGAPAERFLPESSIGVALDGNENPLVCAVGCDGNAYTISYNFQTDSWGSWSSIGAPNTATLVGNAAAGYLVGNAGSGQVWAIALASDGNTWIAEQSAPGGAWSAWTCVGSAGGGFVGGGSLGAQYADQLYAGGVGGDGNFYLAGSQSGQTWAPWQPLGCPPTQHQPMFTYSVAALDTAGTLDMGNTIGIALDGNSPFSIGIWVRLVGRHDPAVLLQKGTELTISLAGTTGIDVALGSSSVQAQVDLQLGAWHYIAVTFAPAGQSNNTGGLIIYVDGNALLKDPAPLTGIASTDADFITGNDLHAEIYNVSMWSACLAAPECLPLWSMPAATPTLAASFWFANNVAVDISGNGNVLTPQNGAAIRQVGPGLYLDGASYAAPSRLDPPNPGGGSAPFSITAWIYPQKPKLLPHRIETEEVVLFANGAAWSAASLVCSLEYHKKTGTFVWIVQRGGLFGTTVAATQAIAADGWSHVAVTYDGSTLTLYVDGAVAGSSASGAIPALAMPAITIGAVSDSGAAHDLGAFYIGGIQSIGVWTTALSAAEIAIAATTDPTPLSLTSCAAFYRFGMGSNAQNTITGVPIGLCQNASLQDFAVPSPSPASAAAPRPRPYLPRVRHRPPSLLDLLEADPPAREVQPVSSLISPGDFDQLHAAYAELVATAPAPQRAQLSDLFEQNLYRGVRLQSAAGGPTPGMVTHALVGDEVVFHYHAASGADEIARASAAVIDQCTAWIIDIVATAIGLIATVIGVSFSVVKVVQYYLRTIERMANAIMRGAAQAAVELKLSGTDLALRLARAVYNAGLLGSTISEGLSGYSWWNWIFAAVGLCLNIIALWVTGGWWLAFVAAQLGFVIGQLVHLATHPPKHCRPGPHLGVLSPSSAAAGGVAFTLNLGGASFKTGATVYWNGSARTTTYDNHDRISAQITAADIATAGTAKVTVTNPDTDASNSLVFEIS